LSDERYWYVIAEQVAPAPHLAHPEGCAALSITFAFATLKREFKFPWRKAGPPDNHDDDVDSDQ